MAVADYVGGGLDAQGLAIEIFTHDSPKVTRILGPAGAAITQLASDHDRKDLTGHEPYTRVAAQVVIAGISGRTAQEVVGAPSAAACLVTKVSCVTGALGTFTAATMFSGGLNWGMDTLTDNSSWGESIFGNWN